MSEYEEVHRVVDGLRAKGLRSTPVALVLGSGLGAFADQLEGARAVPYAELDGFPEPTVPGHAGELVQGSVEGIPVTVMRGRVHAYEGYTTGEVVRPLRALVLLGVRAVIITNAAGGIRPDFTPGDLMLITDHINLTGDNAMVGPLGGDWPKSRFADMSQAYDPQLNDAVDGAARKLGLRLRRGVYAGALGGSYETPAEVRMLRLMGADAVGMSTVHEVTAASHLGARVAGISCITNLASGITGARLDHSEVTETAGRIRAEFTSLLVSSLPRIHAYAQGGA